MKIEGIITPIVTPFKEGTQEIDYDATRVLVNRLIDRGIHGLFPLGTNGEFHVLSDEEKIEFAKVVIEETNHRVPVYVGTGSNSTKHTIELSNKMKELGADAVSIVTPYFLIPSDEEIYNHYKMIAENVDLPIIIYNIPKCTGMNLSADVLKRLVTLPNIKAIKDSSGKFDNLQGYLDAVQGTDVTVLIGSDSTILKGLTMGASGAVAGTSNCITKEILGIYNSFKEGNMDKAVKYQESIEPYRAVLKLATTPAIMKMSVTLDGEGCNAGPARYPVSPLNNDQIEKVKEVVEYYHNLVI
ncbi:4-hydroxy-tetrahydrodipicolinate synthase [Anaerorhabdus sp.]|uniref:4-hydroxy-tetrahydrodipicolinate synthase n=1 Tax=Anaerorhabdus sp. TaxID=1872524 RepID=UPI002FCC4594